MTTDESEATQTFTPTGEDLQADGRRVELFDPSCIEERVVGSARPESFEEHFPFSGQLGQGGMGQVFLARDAVLARDVAVKVLRARLRTDSKIVRRFLREAQVTAQLEHPNVIPFHALENTGDGSPAFVMKVVEGETFKEYTKRCKEAWGTRDWDHKEFGVKARVELFLKVCDAMAYSHSRGVLHRDIKPSNIMRGDFNVVYVMDWGIARLVGAQGGDESVTLEGAEPEELPETRTMTGDLVGTPLYMSPEQVLRDSDELTPASDQYSLGLLLFNLITCERPRKGGDVFLVIERAGRGELLPFPRNGPGREAPKELRAIIERATRPNPDLRYASVEELAADLRRFLHGEEVRACPDNFVRAAWRKVTAHPTVTLASLLAIVSFAGVTTTWSLIAQLEQRELAEQRTEFLTELVSDVTHHVQRLDSGLSRAERVLAVIANDVENRLAWREQSDPRWLTTADLLGEDAPEDTRIEVRYGRSVSFEAPLRLLMPDAEPEVARTLEGKLGDLTELLRDPFIGSLDESRGGDYKVEDIESEKLLDALHEGARLQYAYLGFEVGPYYCFPAIDYTAPGYDHRDRPWYLQGREQAQPTWGAPYADASGSGYLLPCNVALRAPDGTLSGVAGLSMAMDEVIDNLEVPTNSEARVVRLVGDDGMVLIDSRDWGKDPAAGLHGNQMKEAKSLDIPELERELAEGELAGVLVTDDSIYVWSRFRTMDWCLVVEISSKYLDA